MCNQRGIKLHEIRNDRLPSSIVHRDIFAALVYMRGLGGRGSWVFPWRVGRTRAKHETEAKDVP